MKKLFFCLILLTSYFVSSANDSCPRLQSETKSETTMVKQSDSSIKNEVSISCSVTVTSTYVQYKITASTCERALRAADELRKKLHIPYIALGPDGDSYDGDGTPPTITIEPLQPINF
jgi:hypothetical protein